MLTLIAKRPRPSRRYLHRRRREEASWKPEVPTAYFRALELLENLTREPRTYASTREGLLLYVTAVLLMAGISDPDSNTFFSKYVKISETKSKKLGSGFSETWALDVIEGALELLS